MNESLQWQKVSFTEYLNKDGSIIKTFDFTLSGEVLMFENKPYLDGSINLVTVSCFDGELYFVPFESLTFIDELN